jgi:hypothetical protein
LIRPSRASLSGESAILQFLIRYELDTGSRGHCETANSLPL